MGVETTEKTVKTKRKVTRWTCDFCGASSTKNKGCCGHSPFMECQICKRWACEEHYHLDYDGGGDYPQGVYCTECWDVGQPYRETLQELETSFDEDCEQTEKAWKRAALEAIEDKKVDKT